MSGHNAGQHVVNIVSMNPNKRGPVELQMAAVAKAWTATGGTSTCYFSQTAPDWFTQLMDGAGARLGVIDTSHWDREVLRICAEEKPAIVHFHFGNHTVASTLAKQGIVVVRSEHSQRAAMNLPALRVLVRWWRQRPVSAFICVAEFIADQTRRDFRAPEHKIKVVLNTTDLERFRPRPEQRQGLREALNFQSDDIVITLAANLIPRKRQRLLMEAMPHLLRTVPTAVAVLAGDGPDREELTEYLRTADLGDRVRLLFGDNDVAELYAASDIAVLLSTGEGLPGGAIEALACGLPLAATAAGGTAEVYEQGVSGVTISDDSPQGVAQVLARLAGDAGLRARMAVAARVRAEALFGVDRAARESLAVYQDLLK